MSYARVNTFQPAAVGSAADTAVTVKLPNLTTGALPAGQTGQINGVGDSYRWRIKSLVASLSATPAAPVPLTITDGTFTWTVYVTDTVILTPLDLQCAPGAEVDITLGAAASAVGAVNLSVVSE